MNKEQFESDYIARSGITKDQYDEVSANIKGMFTVQCNACKSHNVSISFYSGFIHSCGGDTGSLTIECEDCKKIIQIDD